MTIDITTRIPLQRETDWVKNGYGLAVPLHFVKNRRPIAVDFFCGAGGMSLGTIQGGFEVIAGFDNDEAAAVTYMYNLCTHPCLIHFADDEAEARLEKYMEKHVVTVKKGVVKVITSGQGWLKHHPEHPGVSHFFFGDVRKWTTERILSLLGVGVGDIDLVTGGPPCQGFSKAGKQNVMDPRNSLIFEFARFVVELRPKSMVMEEVPDIVYMLTPEGVPVIDAICRILENGEYGSYEALKKSLSYNTNARAALRQRKTQKEKQPEAQEMPTLFDLEAIH